MVSTLKVSTEIREGFKTDVKCSHPFVIDQPKQGGGTDQGPNPLEIFLSSLGACVCAIGRIIANQKRLDIKGINVDIEGDINKAFLLGTTKEGRAGFEEIRAKVNIDADMTEQEKQNLIAEIAKRCPVADNMANQSTIKTSLV